MGGRNSTDRNVEYASTEIAQDEAGENTDIQQTKPGFFSHLIFEWITPTLKLGKQRPLVEDDLNAVVGQISAKELTESLQHLWDSEVRKCRRKGKNPRLWRTVLRSVSFKAYLFLITCKVVESASKLSQAVFLSLLLATAMQENTEHSPDSMRMVYVYATALCLASLLAALCGNHLNYLGYLIGTHTRASVSGLVYNKVLELGESSLAEVTSGRIVNLIARDVQPFPFVAGALVYHLVAPFVVLAVCLATWQLVGAPALTGIAFMLLCILCHLEIGNAFMTSLCEKASAFTDRRLALVNDVISGIRILKMNAWEWLFRDLIGEQRRSEIRVLMRKSILQSMMYGFPYQLVGTFISLISLLYAGYILTAQNIFTTTALINVLGRVFYTNFVYGVDFGSRSWDALNRVEEFLLTDETDDNDNDGFPSEKIRKNSKGGRERGVKSVLLHDNLWAKFPGLQGSKSITAGMNPLTGDISAVHMNIQNLTCEYNGNTFLHNISLNLHGNQLVAVTGPIGCGKSSLLQAILGELPIAAGQISGRGVISYVPQRPWLFSGTVRDNILFGRKFDEKRYNKTVDACALRKDFDLLPAGDMTHIGERGASLSGGQRARVSLARAVYIDADIYLLDDPLCAVDSQVSKHIFENCIEGILSKRALILVTHHTKQLKKADRVFVLSGGIIANQGTYTELLDSSEYIKFLESKEKTSASTNEGPAVSNKEQEASPVEHASLESNKGLMTVEEDRSTGTVSFTTYWKFFKLGIAPAFLLVFTVMLFLPDVASVATDVFLTEMPKFGYPEQRARDTLLIYGGLAIAAILLALVRGAALFLAFLRSSEKLHNKMLTAILKTSVRFFDTNPGGRVLNRFSKDMSNVDELLPLYITGSLQYFSFTITTFVLVSVANFWVSIAAIATLPMMLYIGWYYLRSAREMKRVEAITASPLCSHFADTIEGIVSIRAYNKEKDFLNTLYSRQNINNTAWLSFTTSMVWVSTRLNLLACVLLVAVTAAAIFTAESVALVGLSINYALQVLGAATLTALQAAEAENFMTSVERGLEYSALEPEEGYNSEERPDEGWPWKGHVHLNNTSLTYYPGGPKTLKGATVRITGGEKIGIVGRTGAGKSSLIAALFRMPEYEGSIVVDGVSLQAINIQASRSAFAVVPQSPFMFSATLRRNLDPFDKYSDQEIWQVLEDVQISSAVKAMPDAIHSQVNEGGSNFSVGERQLFCLARALLLRKKIVILDEATANVDLYTDQVIQTVIRKQLKGCTVLTIAHRLDTVLDYDKILVLNEGGVAEFGTPDELKKNEGGIFFQLFQSYNLKKKS